MPQVDLFKNKTAFPLIFGTIMTLSIIWGAIGYGWMKNYGVTYAYLGYDLDGDKDDPLYVIDLPYISPVSPLYLPVSPLYLPYSSPVAPLTSTGTRMIRCTAQDTPTLTLTLTLALTLTLTPWP